MITKDDLLTLAEDWAQSEEDSGTLILGYSLHYCLLHHVYDEFFPTVKPRTAKQIKQQKLASQLWQLTGASGAIKNLIYRNESWAVAQHLQHARKHLELAERVLRADLKDIK